MMMLGGGMGQAMGSGFGDGLDGILPLLLLTDNNLLGSSSGKLDMKTLLLFQMINGGQLFNAQGSWNI